MGMWRRVQNPHLVRVEEPHSEVFNYPDVEVVHFTTLWGARAESKRALSKILGPSGEFNTSKSILKEIQKLVNVARSRSA